MTSNEASLILVREAHCVKNNDYRQKHYWDAEKKYNCVHLNSLFILIKYVTRYVTTQIFRMWLTTFSTLIFGWTTN